MYTYRKRFVIGADIAIKLYAHGVYTFLLMRMKNPFGLAIKIGPSAQTVKAIITLFYCKIFNNAFYLKEKLYVIY